MISELMSGLVKANLAAAAAIVVVLLARRAVRARFGARAAYALWAAPLIAGVAVLLPHPARQAPLPPVMAQAAAVADVFDASATPVEVAPARAALDPAQVAFGVWLAGARAATARRAVGRRPGAGRLDPALDRHAGRLRGALRRGRAGADPGARGGPPG